MPSPSHPSEVLWHAKTDHGPMRAALQEKADADVVIIGGGLTGISTALHLAQRGISTVLLERTCIAWGASGRNAGIVAPMLGRGDPEDVVAKLGSEAGDRLNGFIAGSGDVVFDLAHRHAIDCNAEKTGFLQPAHAATALPALRRRFEQWQGRGKPVDLLDRESVAAMTGAKTFAGGLVDRSGGQIDPVKFTLGLAAAAEHAGARIFENTVALGLQQSSEGWRIPTPRGSVAAGRVLLATNALAGDLWPRLHRSLMPLTVHQLATKPIRDEAVLSRVLPARQAATDTGAHPFSFRYDADNRLISAAVSILPWGAGARMSRLIRRRLATRLSLPEVPEEDFIWSGVAALTSDFLPRLHELAPGLTAVIGCNGRGIAVCTALGPELADLLTGHETPPPFPYSEVEPITGYWLQRHGPRIYMPLANWRDNRDKAKDNKD